MLGSVRVLVVDNDPTARMLTNSLLINWGYEPVLAMGTGNKLIIDAKEKARTKSCVLALIDMRLYDDEDKDDDSGLILADELEKKIRCVILSGYRDEKILLRVIQEKKNINFLLKNTPVETLRESIEIEVRKVSALKRNLQFDSLSFIDDISRTALWNLIKEYPDQAVEVIARLFPAAKNLRVEKMRPISSKATFTSAPRPTSIIFYIYEDQRYDPYIVKLARTEKIQEEYERYNKYIVGMVTERFTSRLVKAETLWEIGCAAYTYPGDDNVVSFSEFFEEKTVEEIEGCLRFFFMNVWSRHYTHAIDCEGISIYKMYNNVWGEWFEKCIRAFPVSAPLDISFATRDLQAPEPILWLQNHVVDSASDISIVAKTRRAVTHGDLHGDNLLVDSNHNPLVIDYERCGDGHALQDFIELEADIISRLGAHSQNPFEYIRMFIFILKHKKLGRFGDLEDFSTTDRKRIMKTLRVISGLRSLALECVGINDAREYVFGLLFNILFRATISHYKYQDRGQHQSLVLASIACHRLDHWDEQWPPVEWNDHFK